MQRVPHETSGCGQAPTKSFLVRLAKDCRGNTLALVGGALIPLLAMIGSGVDMSRAYMTQTRLQQACDAGVLAARKTMTLANLDSKSKEAGQQFFTTNFPQGMFGSRDAVFTTTDGPGGEVVGEATVDLPTAVMHLFGNEMFELVANCNARLDIANTDIMFVLDVTGSMDQNVPGSSTKKITALKAAVKDFYDALDDVEKGNSRVRFGFVPYSSNVNVGKLLPAGSIISDKWTYQSREFKDWANYKWDASDNWCSNRDGSRMWRYDYEERDWRIVCRWRTQQKSSEADFHEPVYTYKPRELSVSNYVAGSNATLPTFPPGTTKYSDKWEGCIEERDTVATSSISVANAKISPSGMLDLDIDLPATSRASRWRPYWPDVSYNRSGVAHEIGYGEDKGHASAACPASARKLTEMTESAFDSYVNGLAPVGGTYHDVGMIWGARFLSPDGLFATENSSAPNGFPISRHIVFMTDGQMSPETWIYGLYGHERLDLRVTGSEGNVSKSEMTKRHNARFAAICTAAQQKGYTIWVVAFDAALSNEMLNCASDPAKAFVSKDEATLRQQFREIATNIAGLRLSK